MIINLRNELKHLEQRGILFLKIIPLAVISICEFILQVLILFFTVGIVVSTIGRMTAEKATDRINGKELKALELA